MGLFGRSEEKTAGIEAAKAEAARLNGLSPEAMALEIMPAFGPDGPREGKEINVLQVAVWLMRDCSRGAGQLRDLHRAVCEGLQVLEHAQLVQAFPGSRGSIATGARARATRRGEAALAGGDVASYLGAAA